MQDQPERKLVGAVVDLFAERLFWAHVAGRARPCAFAGEVFCFVGGKGDSFFLARCSSRRGGCACLAGKAEVEDLYPPIFGEHDVFGLKVAVHDSCGMGGSEAIGDLRRDLNEFADGDGFAVKQGPKRLALDQFTDDVLLTLSTPKS